MKRYFILAPLIAAQSALLTSCASMNDSLLLGASMGAIVGGGATYVGQSTTGGQARVNDVALGAGIGIATGLFTAYFTPQ